MTKKHYKDISSKVDFPKIEKEILKFWEDNKIFEKSIENRSNNDDFVFYDGPPFANGLPHYGHLVTGYVKDIIPRYKTMQGYKVDRQFGWDTHGLPAELQAEKELGVSGRLEILDYGIEKFNKHCETSVLRFTNEWKDYVTRQGRWVDFEDSYKTLDENYMESVIWAFKELYDKGYIYQDFKVVPYSWAVESPLSNFETRMDNATRSRQDPTATVGFELNGFDKKTYICAWTTTPWTLPSNLALAVGSELEYVIYENENAQYIFGSNATAKYKKDMAKMELNEVRRIKGSELEGVTYKPLFDFFKDNENSFKILATDWVEDGEGTGCVHLAPGFGEIDMEACRDAGIKLVVPVDSKGRFTSEVPLFEGKHVFECNKEITNILRESGNLIKFETYVHNYPHCWRTDEPIIYKAINGWYVAVTKFKDRMCELNQDINWIPGHVKDGQFGKWIANTKDWNISRNRFWGAPIPVWMSDDPSYPRIDVYGSVDEIEKDFGVRPKTLHRPDIDNITRPNPNDPTGKSKMVRVEDVLDCWFESGSMPFAKLHYPFENKELFEENFPGDFIVEYVAQTRGWFYTLMIMSTALFDRAPFKNCICHGVVLDADNQKLSKRLKNYPDPQEMFEKHGSDAMRWYMVSANLLNGGDLSIDKNGNGISQVVRTLLIPIWNAYYFFTLYANIDGIKANKIETSENILDKYILSKQNNLIKNVEESLDNYNIPLACKEIHDFVDALNNWYIRRSRERFWNSNQEAFDTLYTVLIRLCEIASPLLPMLSDYIYQGLNGDGNSVHLVDWPTVDVDNDDQLVSDMDFVREICSTALSIREREVIRIRQPLSSVTVVANNDAISKYSSIIKDEINVKEVIVDNNLEKYGSMQVILDSKVLGKKLGKDFKDVLMASKNGEFNVVDENTICIAGHNITSDVYDFKVNTKEGIISQTASDGRTVVVLDTQITTELEIEGMARDVIRGIQSLRKDSGLNIDDRIVVHLDGDNVSNILSSHRELISGEVLANDIVENSAVLEFSVEIETCNSNISISIKVS